MIRNVLLSFGGSRNYALMSIDSFSLGERYYCFGANQVILRHIDQMMTGITEKNLVTAKHNNLKRNVLFASVATV